MAYAEVKTTRREEKEGHSMRGKRPHKSDGEIDHMEIHEGENGGHLVVHHFHPESHGLHGGYGVGMDGKPAAQPEHHMFGEGDGHEMLAHVAHHMNVKEGEPEGQKEEEAENE